MCVGYIFSRSTPSPNRDKVTTGPMLLNMKNNIFPLISNKILQKVLTLFTMYSLKRWLLFIEICMWY